MYVGTLETSPVRIGEGTWIGDRVAVLRGANIGKQCVIGTNSVVRGTIPDYSIAVGAPAKVVGSTKR
jgi:acetyltransferase-like isoleucine patch superfamily enzyme